MKSLLRKGKNEDTVDKWLKEIDVIIANIAPEINRLEVIVKSGETALKNFKQYNSEWSNLLENMKKNSRNTVDDGMNSSAGRIKSIMDRIMNEKTFFKEDEEERHNSTAQETCYPNNESYNHTLLLREAKNNEYTQEEINMVENIINLFYTSKISPTEKRIFEVKEQIEQLNFLRQSCEKTKKDLLFAKDVDGLRENTYSQLACDSFIAEKERVRELKYTAHELTRLKI